MENVASRWRPENDDEYEAARAELKRRFVAWASRGDDIFDPDAGETLLHYKWGYVDGHLTRWTRRDLDEVLLELYPAKVIVELDELDDALDEVRTFLAFLAEAGLLDEESEPTDVLIDHLDRIKGAFRFNMADRSRYSFGKRLMTEAAAEGVRPDDQTTLDAFIQRFNARPRAERDAILGGGPTPERRRTTGRFTPPGTPPRPTSAKRRKRRR